jgi:hypothetical protein
MACAMVWPCAWAHDEDPKDQHVERALGRLALQRRLTLGTATPHST